MCEPMTMAAVAGGGGTAAAASSASMAIKGISTIAQVAGTIDAANKRMKLSTVTPMQPKTLTF